MLCIENVKGKKKRARYIIFSTWIFFLFYDNAQLFLHPPPASVKTRNRMILFVIRIIFLFLFFNIRVRAHVCIYSCYKVCMCKMIVFQLYIFKYWL